MNSETPASPQSKNKIWIALAAGGLALLVICLIAAAVIILPAVASIGQSTVSYNGIADEQLKSDTLNLIAQYEQTKNGCNEVTLFIGNLQLRPDQTTDRSWSEMWQVNACGESHLYNLIFTPDGAGGTYISVSPLDQ